MRSFLAAGALAGSAAAAATAAAAAPNPHTCATEPARSAAWCDHTQPRDARVQALVNALTADEKAGLLVNGAAAVPRLGLPAYDWWSEALHGVARDGVATSFPQIIGVSSSYNRTLFHALGELTGTEARGKNNGLAGGRYQGLTMWAPNVNIFRDPRWGRGQETPGEDPTLNGEYAVQYVTGLQGDEHANGYLRTSACLKHYAAYSLETGRQQFPAVVDSQDMLDSYLPAFEDGVKRGFASGLMCSYNAETYGSGVFGNGTAAQHGAIPSCANQGLLNDLIRDQWGFDGYVTSDCNAVSDVQNQHHYTQRTDDTVTAVLEAGMDTDCGNFMNAKVMSAYIAASDANARRVDVALARLLHIQMRLGFFDPLELNPFGQLGSEVVDTPAHRQLAREAADQSLVLLKNAHTALPLGGGGGGGGGRAQLTVAVLGRNANATANMQGNYFGQAPFLISPLAGVAAVAGVTATFDDGTNTHAATGLAAAADAVVLVVGLTSEGVHPSDEAEGHDRTSLMLPDDQDQYIGSVAKAAKAADGDKPVVLLVMGGGPVDVSAWRDSDDVDAIMWVGYPGQSGGAAIADALVGATNPSGKLTQTWYPQAFADKVSVFDMHMRPNATSGNPGRGHRFYTGTPVFKFGEGMGYAPFAHGPLTVAKAFDEESQDGVPTLKLSVEVRNTGERDGAEVVLVFAAPPHAGVGGAPLQMLVGFERVHVRAGRSTRVDVEVPAKRFAFAEKDEAAVEVRRGQWSLWTGVRGADSQVVSLQF